MNEVESLLQMNYATVIIGLFIILFAIKEIIEIISYFKKKFGIKTVVDSKEEEKQAEIDKLKKHDEWQYDKINEICGNINDLKEMIIATDERQKKTAIATCRSTLYRLYKEGMKKGYITQLEFETFEDLAEVYLSAGGNHSTKSKIIPEYRQLPIKD